MHKKFLRTFAAFLFMLAFQWPSSAKAMDYVNSRENDERVHNRRQNAQWQVDKFKCNQVEDKHLSRWNGYNSIPTTWVEKGRACSEPYCPQHKGLGQQYLNAKHELVLAEEEYRDTLEKKKNFLEKEKNKNISLNPEYQNNIRLYKLDTRTVMDSSAEYLLELGNQYKRQMGFVGLKLDFSDTWSEYDFKEKAILCYELAAGKGNLDAKLNLGICYMSEDGILTKHKPLAVPVFRELTNVAKIPSILAPAHYYLGRCYENGYGVDKSEKVAAKHYLIAVSSFPSTQHGLAAKSRLLDLEYQYTNGEWKKDNCNIF